MSTNDGNTPPGNTPPASAPPAGVIVPPAAPPGDGNIPPPGSPPASGVIAPPAPGDGNTPTPGDPPPPGPDDWAPEKLRVLGADGKLDEAATARKIAESYTALEKRLGSGALPPATPEEYKLAPIEGVEGVDQEMIDGFLAADGTKEFIGKLHAKGASNELVNLIANEYLAFVPQLLTANAQVSVDECMADLGKLWPDQQNRTARIADVTKAISAFASGDGTPEGDELPGSAPRLYKKFASDPDFIAFAAAVAAEQREDIPPQGGDANAEADIKALQGSRAYWDANDPQHAIVKAKVQSFYDRKFGGKKR